MGAGRFWNSYIKKTNYELLEKECGTDPRIFDSINLNIDYWGMEDIDKEDKEE